MDALESEAASAFSGADAAFCALGTTRGVAGSAQAFKRVLAQWSCCSWLLAALLLVGSAAAAAAGADHDDDAAHCKAEHHMWAYV